MADFVTPGRLKRARMAARFVPEGSRVADVGCGKAMPLEAVLPVGSTYVPVDVVRRDARTLVVDLNVEPLPPLDVDVVIGLGLLEYLNDVPGFLTQLPSRAVMSYAPLEQTPGRDRAASGWKNSYTTESLSMAFQEAGFTIVDLIACTHKQWLWHLVRNPQGSAAP